AGAVVVQWLGQAPLILEPVIALLAQLADAVTSEKRGVNAAFGGFPIHRLGSVFAKFDGPGLGRLAPGATRAIEAAVLVGFEQGTNILLCVVATQPMPGNAAQRPPASGGAGIRLETGGGLETIVTGHAMPRELGVWR